MSAQTQRSYASVLALALTASLWLPMLSANTAQARPSAPFTVARPPAVVLM